jgi:hypothetical protein
MVNVVLASPPTCKAVQTNTHGVIRRLAAHGKFVTGFDELPTDLILVVQDLLE